MANEQPTKISASCPACKDYLSTSGNVKNVKVFCENCGIDLKEYSEHIKQAVKDVQKKKNKNIKDVWQCPT